MSTWWTSKAEIQPYPRIYVQFLAKCEETVFRNKHIYDHANFEIRFISKTMSVFTLNVLGLAVICKETMRSLLIVVAV